MSYQPIVIEKAQHVVDVLHENNFFEDYEIGSDEFAMNYFCDVFTEKFINEGLDDDGPHFSEDQMDKYLREVIVGSIIHDLQENGILDSVEDEDNQERYFLTEKGKEYSKDIEGKSDWEGLS